VRYGIVLRLRVTEGGSRRRAGVGAALERIVTVDTVELERWEGLPEAEEKVMEERREGKEGGRMVMDDVGR
jgi:hypothetical protein